MKLFKESIKNLKEIGSITPSSKYLIDKCLEPVDFANAATILEFGVGDGCITEEILKKATPNCKIVALEINENLYEYGKKKFGKHHNLRLELATALDYEKILEKNKINQVDYIISSLPLSLFKQEEIDDLFQKISSYLAPNGAFIQYQYSIGKYSYLKTIFKKVKIDFTMRNTPPAFIFTCTNL